jgi:3-hydroxyisobutyrate dehydrogenase-like beta-hydroxyacid dehydrogenase
MAAKLINQALVGIHAQAAVEALRLAEKLELKDTKLLQELLNHSWGQSRLLDLTMTDYHTVKDLSSSFDDTLQKIKESSSPAPLRNLYKDFHCIESEIKGNSRDALFIRSALPIYS